MNQIQSILFLILWVACVLSWFFSIFELFCSYFFNKFFFHIGIPIIRRIEHIPKRSDSIRLDCVYKTKHGKFIFIANNECLFIRKFHLLKARSLIRGSAKWEVPYAEPYAKTTGRIPLGPTIFLCCFSIGWTVVSIGYATLIITILPWIILLPLHVVIFIVGKIRFNTLIDELRELVSGKHQGNITQQK